MSRGLRSRILSLSCVLWLSASAAHAEPVASPPGAKVSAGQLIAEKNGFVAGLEGASVSLVEGAELRLAPGTHLRFGRTFKLPMGPGVDSLPTRVLMLDSGQMDASVSAKHFALFVESPRKLRSILFEGSLTAIASAPRSIVALAQGRAVVALDDAWKWKHLAEASAQIVSDVRPDGYRRALVAATDTPVLSRSLMLSGSGEEASSLLAWPALPQAVGYEVQLRRVGSPAVEAVPSASSGPAVVPTLPLPTQPLPTQPLPSEEVLNPSVTLGHELAVRSEHTQEPRILLADLAPGTYQVTVRGVDDSGLFGPSSPPVALNVVGLDIPKTASRGPNGAVRLQTNQRVLLIGAEGLLVAYLGLDDFLPAPKSIGLVARRPISLVLRHPTSGETLRLDLEPLSVRAQVSFGRHPQSWPYEGLELAVKLVDDRGDPVPENFPVTCKVTINIEPVAPTWERTGSVLRTRLEHPLGSAPWMVRVDVLDENGASLGMDFSEVAYQAPSPTHAQR
ncbi:MAG: hypothetical protein ABI895_20645 [Deltaproteobacteria bacterium]